MKQCVVELQDFKNTKLHGLGPETRRKMVNALKFKDPKARYLPSVRMGRWDGTVSFCTIGGQTYIPFLPKLLEIVVNDGYEVTLVDNRPDVSFSFPTIDETFLSSHKWSEGQFKGEPIVLREHQVNAINSITRNDTSTIVAATSAGKCQPYDRKILTESGWRTIGEIQENDTVLTPKGKSAKVLKTYEPGIKKTYLVTFEDGRQTVTCGDHIWTTSQGQVTTSELDGHIIPLVEKLALPEKNMENAYDMGKMAFIKGIPNDILEASDQQRLDFLQAMMDAGGYANKNGDITFAFGNDDMREKLAYLFRSFGAIVFMDKLLTIQHPNPNMFFTMDKKCIKITPKDIPGLKVSSVEFYSSQEVKCIEIDDPDHLYITDDFIVTHNTLICGSLCKLAETYGRTITVVPNRDLVDQTYADYKMIGLDAGKIYYGQKDLDNQHTVTTWQSLHSINKKHRDQLSDDEIERVMDGVQFTIQDEVHLATSKVMFDINSKLFKNIPLCVGMTGTIPKEDHLRESIRANFGEIVYEIPAHELQEKGILAKCEITLEQICLPSKTFKDYHAEKKFLAGNEESLEIIVNDVAEAREDENSNTLILVENIDTGLKLEKMIPDSIFLYGDIKNDERKKQYKEVSGVSDKVIIATYGIASTGISINRLFNLFLFNPGKSFTRTIQSIGRGLRVAEDKDFVKIRDYSYNTKYSKKHMNVRKTYYKESRYPFTLRKRNI